MRTLIALRAQMGAPGSWGGIRHWDRLSPTSRTAMGSPSSMLPQLQPCRKSAQ